MDVSDRATTTDDAAWPFYKRMCVLLPSKSSSYEPQELTLLREVFQILGMQPPS